MTTLEIGKQLVELCRAGKNHEAMQKLYAPDIVSVEAGAPPGQSPETKGLDGCLAKSKAWTENHQIHKAEAEGPFPHGDRFAVLFKYDLTRKTDNKRFPLEEVALYTVKNDKISREEFFYAM
jgi:hypothetical protein